MLGLAVLAVTTPAHASDDKTRYDEIIQRMVKEGRDDLPVIVRYKDSKSSDHVRKTLQGRRAQIRREMKQLRAMGISVDRAALKELMKGPEIESVSYDAPMKAFQDPSLPPVPVSIDASGSRAARSRYGVKSTGVLVAFAKVTALAFG